MTPPGPATVQAPAAGLWRVGCGDDPLAVRRPDPNTLFSTTTGNRFDSAEGLFGVLYFATNLEGCFGETLVGFRPSLPMVALVEEEWRERGFMDVGSVPQEWRLRRSSVKVQVGTDSPFLDIESRQTHQFLRGELALGLSSLGYQDLDVSMVRGPDRRVTRLIASWAYKFMPEDGVSFAGIRYLSRIDTKWELWAVFNDVPIEPVETRPILPQTDELRKVANEFGLIVH